jgi:hypothetical protein
MIKLKQIEMDAKKFYEDSFELSLLQEQLEDMLTAIDKNNEEFESGKISKSAFKSNKGKLERSSVKIIKNIKSLINSNLALIKNISVEIEKQAGKKTKKGKKNGTN